MKEFFSLLHLARPTVLTYLRRDIAVNASDNHY